LIATFDGVIHGWGSQEKKEKTTPTICPLDFTNSIYMGKFYVRKIG